jgi:hypothetical protein
MAKKKTVKTFVWILSKNSASVIDIYLNGIHEASALGFL